MVEKKALKMAEKKALMEDIAARIERNKNVPFNPLSHFHLTKLLSVVAPHLYTKEELAQIEDIEETIKNKKRKFQTDADEGLARDGKRVKTTMNEAKGKEKILVETAAEEVIKKTTIKEGKGKEKIMVQTETEEVIKKPTQKKTRKNVNKPKREKAPPLPAPALPVELENQIRELNGSDVKYVMHKKLYETDVNDNNNRLSMPENVIQSDFLTEREMAIVNSKEDRKPVGLEVIVLDPFLREFDMTLKKWSMNSTRTYNLTKNWKQIVKQNRLKAEQEFNIWSFRVAEKLYFLLSNKDV